MIAGGGTGGHAIPALCVADRLRERGAAVEFIGAESGIEATLVPDANFELHSLPLAGFAGGIGARLRAGLLFARAVASCREILRNFRPTAVFGVGGYASAPAVIAANTLKIPTFLHEQNSVPGRVNRFTSRFTKEVLATFPEAAEYLSGAKTVGMPTRKEFFDTSKERALEELGLTPPVAFIFGGSGGALKINLAAMEAFRPPTAYTVVQIAGKRDFPRLSTDNPRHLILEYVGDVWKYIAASDVVVSRAGAGSLFDVAAAGRAAVFIPYPHATGDHQLHNARYFTERDAAVLLPDSEVTPETIRESVENLLAGENRRNELAERIRRLATPHAADEIADRLLAAGTNDDKE
jgi:UDP-N-acetylglucosamine--N-acetylmuramyl-(pentapeptide) pyrophosphoryl-undecaprenol N-acetylglucosamine transferase